MEFSPSPQLKYLHFVFCCIRIFWTTTCHKYRKNSIHATYISLSIKSLDWVKKNTGSSLKAKNMTLKGPKFFSRPCKFHPRIVVMYRSHLTFVNCEVLFTNLLHTNVAEREMTWVLSDVQLVTATTKTGNLFIRNS